MADALTIASGLLRGLQEAFLFVARPATILVPAFLVGAGCAFLFHRDLVPPAGARGRLSWEYLLGLTSALLIVSPLTVWVCVTANLGVRPGVIVLLLGPVMAVLGGLAHVTVFRFGEIENWESRRPRPWHVVAVAWILISASLATLLYLALAGTARWWSLAGVASAMGGLAWYARQYYTGSRIPQLLGSLKLGITDDHLTRKWVPILVACVALCSLGFSLLLANPTIPQAHTYFQAALFSLWIGCACVVLFALSVAGLIVQLGSSAVVGISLALQAFATVVLPALTKAGTEATANAYEAALVGVGLLAAYMCIGAFVGLPGTIKSAEAALAKARAAGTKPSSQLR